jgi:hypothetical protein
MGHVHIVGGVLSALMKEAGSASNFFWQWALQKKEMWPLRSLLNRLVAGSTIMPHTGSRVFMVADGFVGIVFVPNVRGEYPLGVGKPPEDAPASFYALIP